MKDEKVYPVDQKRFSNSHVNDRQYREMYESSVKNPDAFWAEYARKFITWSKPWETVSSFDFNSAKISWFDGAKLNASTNCIDRHLPKKRESNCYFVGGRRSSEHRKITYGELHEEVCRFANAMKSRGVKKGDRVSIYMPMVPEAAVAMLACARIGAVHSVVFGGFSPDALKDRILDSKCTALITADEGVRGGKKYP